MGGAPAGPAAGAPSSGLEDAYDLDEYVYDALQAGASGFLLKDSPPEHVADAIRAARRARPAELDELTPRELEVLRLLARGMSNAEIAEELVLSDTTVKTHVTHVLGKLRLRDRVQAVVLAYESGLVQPGQPPGAE